VKTALKIVLAIIITAITFIPASRGIALAPEHKEEAQEDLLSKYANQYSVPREDLEAVFRCESNSNHEIKPGDKGLSFGGFQIQKETFADLEKKMGEDLDIESLEDQTKMTAFAISTGEGKRWTSYVALKNGGTYTFYSRVWGKTMTVHCNYQ